MIEGIKSQMSLHLEAKSSSSFICSRLNSTTFVIHENDKFEEHPFIYVKVYDEPPILVLSDTGCGGCADEDSHSKNLREYLETCPIDSNHGQPLNPLNLSGKGSKKYMIICTHCHYDHILGLEQFKEESTEIIAAAGGKQFIENDLPEHSLCKSLGILPPRYQITHWAQDYETLSCNGESLDLQVIHTPGHTPDELAWYDQEERHLYVGDSFYERVAEDKSYEQAILFPKEGSLTDYTTSLEKLLSFVEAKNVDHDAHKGRVRIGCGHVTSSVDAEEVLLDVQKLFFNLLKDRVPVVESEQKRGEEFLTWREDGEPRFSVAGPRRLVLEAQ